jgi:hypothetical protein
MPSSPDAIIAVLSLRIAEMFSLLGVVGRIASPGAVDNHLQLDSRARLLSNETPLCSFSLVRNCANSTTSDPSL